MREEVDVGREGVLVRSVRAGEEERGAEVHEVGDWEERRVSFEAGRGGGGEEATYSRLPQQRSLGNLRQQSLLSIV